MATVEACKMTGDDRNTCVLKRMPEYLVGIRPPSHIGYQLRIEMLVDVSPDWAAGIAGASAVV